MIYPDYSKYIIKEIQQLPQREWKAYLCKRALRFQGTTLYKTYIKNVCMTREELGNDYCIERDFTFEYKGERFIYRERVPSAYALQPEYTITPLHVPW